MKRVMLLLSAVIGAALLSGCATGAMNPPDGASYNFSLIKVVLNTALYKSTASNAEAGESVLQRSNTQAEGAEQVGIPLDALPGLLSTKTADNDGQGANINLVPIKANVGLWKSAAGSAEAGITVDQSADVSADGDTDVGLTTDDTDEGTTE